MGDTRMKRGLDTKLIITALMVCMSAVFYSCSAKKGLTERDPADRAAVASIRFFQNVISKADGDRCTMVPSCSQYAIDVIKVHGVFMGWIMTCDRLMRCGGSEYQVSTQFAKGEVTYCLDPVENNDFWWRDAK